MGDVTDILEARRDWVFTFGYGHAHPNCYVKINGTYMEAREVMFERYGDKWAMQYASEEEAGVDRFSLMEVE